MKRWIKENKLLLSLIFLSVAFSFFMVIFFAIDSDYLWHIKAGEHIFHNGILKSDIFSWFMYGKYWMSHEWLFEVIIYGLKIIFPRIHTILYGFLSICTLLLILLLTNKDKYLKNIVYTLIWLAFSLIFVNYMQARPHLISFSFLAITVWLLYDLYLNKEAKKIYFLPLLTILWANFHGGSSNLSYLLCLVFAFCGLFNFSFSKVEAKRISRKQIQKYLIVAVLCMVAVCINVHGVKMFIYPYQNMLDTTMLSNIKEWQPTTLTSLSNYIYFFYLLFIMGTLLFSKKKIEFIDLVLLLLSCYLGLKSIRFWAYTYIIMSYVVFKYVPKKEVEKGTVLGISIISCLLMILSLTSGDKIEKNLDNRLLDKEVISIIKKEQPARLFNMYDYGGELINNDILVFIDGRADLYTNYNYKDYLNISLLRSDYVKLIEKYHFDYFLIDNDYPIGNYLKYNSDYGKIYETEEFTLYKKMA